MKSTISKFTIICLVVALTLSSCKHSSKYVYPQDEDISSNVGIPKKAYINYFPITAAEGNTPVTYDTFHIKLFSKVLFKLGEPILYNFYISKPVIRLTWIRPSGFPMVLSVEDIDGKIQLKENGFEPLTAADKAKNPKDTIKRIYRTKALSFETKKKLMALIKMNKFFDMPTKIDESTSGTQVAIEYHDQSIYYLVYRSISDASAQNGFKEISDYIIDQSNFKSDKRY